jgi:hypothetical protein
MSNLSAVSRDSASASDGKSEGVWGALDAMT